MRSVSPRAQKNSAPLVVYDAEEDLSTRCCVCFTSHPRLMTPCQCNTQYHQTCLLRYIREKLLNMKQELDFSQLRCRTCKQQIRFLYFENTHYNCSHFGDKLGKNWCHKTIILMILLVIAIIAVGILLANHKASQGMVYYGLLIGETILCLVLVIVMTVFVQKNLQGCSSMWKSGITPAPLMTHHVITSPPTHLRSSLTKNTDISLLPKVGGNSSGSALFPAVFPKKIS